MWCCADGHHCKKKAEGLLQESEQKYRILFKTMTQGVVHLWPDGRIISANPAAERILGLSVSQMQERISTDSSWRAIREDGTEYIGETHPSMVAMRTGKAVQNAVMGVFSEKSIAMFGSALMLYRSFCPVSIDHSRFL